jgi:Ca2+-binding RTX toxin-like protein
MGIGKIGGMLSNVSFANKTVNLQLNNGSTFSHTPTTGSSVAADLSAGWVEVSDRYMGLAAPQPGGGVFANMLANTQGSSAFAKWRADPTDIVLYNDDRSAPINRLLTDVSILPTIEPVHYNWTLTAYLAGGDDQWVSGKSKDIVDGGDGNDTISTGHNNDVIDAGAGNDVINGGAHKDTLTGGAGKDTFVFDVNIGGSNVDVITDYYYGDDAIKIDNAIFSAVKGTGIISQDQFSRNTSGKAESASDRIIYDTDDGFLYYDADGTGSGQAIAFAELKGAPTISNADIVII